MSSYGIHRDVPFEDYCRWPALNVSTLCRGFISDGKIDVFSPLHLKAAIDGRLKVPDSSDMAFGRALHARLLEPERYAQEFRIAGCCEAVIGSGKRKGQQCGNTATLHYDSRWYCGVKGHAPADAETFEQSISREQADRIERIAERMKGHKAIRLLRAQGGFEDSFIAELDGLPVKGRVDKDCPSPPGKFPPCVIDVKTVQAGRFVDSVFFKQAKSLHYPSKLAWYAKLLEKIDGIRRIGIWVIVEVDEPFSISVRQCPNDLLEWGWRRIKEAFDTYRECMQSGEWPDLYGDLRALPLPDWFEREIYDVAI